MPVSLEVQEIIDGIRADDWAHLDAKSILAWRNISARIPSGSDPSAVVSEVSHRAIEAGGHDVPVRIYRPFEAAAGALLWFHGGGFAMGPAQISEPLAMRIALATGLLVVTVDYRLAPEYPYPAGLDDCLAVTRWVSSTRSDLGVPDGPLIVGGDSAGGALAAAVSLRARDESAPWINSQILLYPMASKAADGLPSRLAPEVPFPDPEALDYLWRLYLPSETKDAPYASPLSARDFSACRPR
jgi:acetyl esterase